MEYRVSVDTGELFTDVVVTDSNGNFTVGKALTDKKRAFNSINSGLAVAAEQLQTTTEKLLSKTSVFIYGTTRATNGIVERKTAKTAFNNKRVSRYLTFERGRKDRTTQFINSLSGTLYP